MMKTFEIKNENSAKFYTYLTLNLISFRLEEKGKTVIFTCDMTDQQFFDAVKFCENQQTKQKITDAVQKCKRLEDEYETIQKVKYSFAEFFDAALKQVDSERKEARKKALDSCIKALLKSELENKEKRLNMHVFTKDEIVQAVTEEGFQFLKKTGRIQLWFDDYDWYKLML